MRKLSFILFSVYLLIFSTNAGESKSAEETAPAEPETKPAQTEKTNPQTPPASKKDPEKDAKKPLELDVDSTLSVEGKDKLEFDADSTFDSVKSELPPGTTEKNIREMLKADPAKGKVLAAKLKEVMALLKETKATKNPKIIKECSNLAASMKILQEYHEGKKDVPDKLLFKAYNDCKYITRGVARMKANVILAKKHTPAAKKIRKFYRSSRNYSNKAKLAAQQGYKAKAEYYRICSKLKKRTAENYASNPAVEKECRRKIKEARKKYKMDDAKESAARFRKRAKRARAYERQEQAEYYDKVATLKERLHKAYRNNDQETVKSILKEYHELRSKK